MKVVRTVHPIGQGAFYTEKFYMDGDKRRSVVYDCGSSTHGLSVINGEIDKTFEKGEYIDAVFISHFHSDHINGIRTLLERCNVKKLFLPIISPECAVLLNTYERSDEISEMINDPENYIRGISPETAVIFVDESDTGYQNDNFFYLDGAPSGNTAKINSGTRISFSPSCSVWEYIPFNLRHEELYEKVRLIVEKISPVIDLYKTSHCKADDLMKELKKAFDGEIKGKDKNINSMILYSGSVGSSYYGIEIKSDLLPDYSYYLGTYPLCDPATGCLYMGDYDLNDGGAFDELMNKYRRVGKNISLVQTPHHGSEHNFNKLICGEFARKKLFFISAGNDNRYHHPHKSVVNAINELNSSHTVTEDISTQLSIVYKN